jgi:hypothetical protein
MKTIWPAAAIAAFFLSSAGHAEFLQPCGWWLKAHNHLRTTYFRDAIVLDVREQAKELASLKYFGARCADLKCMTGTEILKAINGYCTQHPAEKLNRALPVITETAILLQIARQRGAPKK